METTENGAQLADHFPIQSAVDLDFVLGQQRGWPVGMTRESPSEFKRRVLAAAISCQLGLASIDYTLKRYVRKDEYDIDEQNLGDVVSDFIKEAAIILKKELRKLHTKGELTFGQIGAELSLFKLPEMLDVSRMLANRGLFLEVLPVLRMCLEMSSWSSVVFFEADEETVKRLRANTCVSAAKKFYRPSGKLYGYLSRFAHWDYEIHSHFLNIDEKGAKVISASVKYRAMSLLLCLLLIEFIIETVRYIYSYRSKALITRIQGVAGFTDDRNTAKYALQIVRLCPDRDLGEISGIFA